MVIKATDSTTLEKKFQALAAQWKRDCALTSSTSAMVAHPAYQAIIGLGDAVVPLLLRELEEEPVHWFEALKAITGEDPVERTAWGNIPAMAAAWRAWGRAHGLV